MQFTKDPHNNDNHQARVCHDNRGAMDTYNDLVHGNRGNATRGPQGREMGPVVGTEDRRKGIWRYVPELMSGFN